MTMSKKRSVFYPHFAHTCTYSLCRCRTEFFHEIRSLLKVGLVHAVTPRFQLRRTRWKIHWSCEVSVLRFDYVVKEVSVYSQLILSQIRLCKRKCAKKVCHHVFKLYFHLIHLLLNVWPSQAKNNHHEWSFLWPACFFILQWQFCKKWTSRKQWFSGRNQFSGTCLNASEPVRLPAASWFVRKWNTVLK